MASAASSQPSQPASSSDDSSAADAHHRATVDRFVQFWGAMASHWGINRTMAQIHALLYCAGEPLNTDDIMARLDISRGNANMNLRSLTEWDLVEKVHLSGSRKDFYVAQQDVWHITAQIIKERERRELQPVREQLKALQRDLKDRPDTPCDALSEPDATLCQRLQNLIELMEVFEGFVETLLPFIETRDTEALQHLVEAMRAAPPPDGPSDA